MPYPPRSCSIYVNGKKMVLEDVVKESFDAGNNMPDKVARVLQLTIELAPLHTDSARLEALGTFLQGSNIPTSISERSTG